MSTLRELPTTIEETSRILSIFDEYHEKNPGTTVPTTLVLDTAHEKLWLSVIGRLSLRTCGS